MSESIVTFEVPGQPQGQGRARARHVPGKGGGKGFVTMYDPKESRNYKATIQAHAQQAMIRAGLQPFTGPVELRFEAIFLLPKTYHRKTKPVEREWHTGKPDTDNIQKAIQDAGNGVLWLDDAQVAKTSGMTIRGAQGEPPLIRVTVLTLGGKP